jgi:phosphoserine phosphatase RsbU/P
VRAREAVLVNDVEGDPRYMPTPGARGVRAELAVPIVLGGRVLGVVNVESTHTLDDEDVAGIRVVADQLAVAIENARLYEEVRATQERLEKEVRFARRVQAALLPAGPPKRMKGVEVAAAFASARELGGDFHDYLAPESNTLVVAVGDVSGKGVPAALYSAFAAELVRGRTFRGRYLPERSSPANVLSSVNTILHQRQLEEYFCTLCYAIFDLKRRALTLANSGLPYPVRCSVDGCAQVELPGVPLGSFEGSAYDEVTFALHAGDTYVFCTDGVSEAMNADNQEFTAARLVDVVTDARNLPPKGIVDAIFAAVAEWRGGAPPNDDMTAVAVKITA